MKTRNDANTTLLRPYPQKTWKWTVSVYYNIQQREAGRDQQITPVGIADVTALIIAGVHLRFSYPFPAPPPPPLQNLACMVQL